MLVAATVAQILVMVGAPVALVLSLRRRWRSPWTLVAIGAATFVASQVVHIPLNLGLTALVHVDGMPRVPRGWTTLFDAVVLGLTAGLCEELARYVVLRRWLRTARSLREAVALGAGHGGVEALLMGLGVALTLVNMGAMRGLDVGDMGLPPEQAELAARQITEYWRTAFYLPLLGGLERLGSIVFHVAASCLVMLAVVDRRPRWLLLAIGWHALTDGVVVYGMARWGIVPTEGALAVLALGSAALLWVAVRAFRDRGAVAPPAAPGPAPPAPSWTTPVEVLAVTKTFSKSVRALDGASFTIAPGARVCLLGPNGAGKTTMIRLITGGLEPSAGLVRLFGRQAGEPEFLEAKRRVGIVPQSPGMYGDVRVRDYLELVRTLYGRGDVDEAIDALRLREHANRNMAELSGGLQRRLAIAAALLPRPDLLLLDEPTVGLDPVAAREVHEALSEIMVGRTTLLCTHNLAEAEDLCDSVVILRAGRVLLHEPIATLRARAGPQLALGAREGSARLAEVLIGLGKIPREHDGLVHVTVVDPRAEAPELVRALVEAGLGIQECRPLEPSLEDLFLEVMKESDARS